MFERDREDRPEDWERREGATGNQPQPHPIVAAVRGVPKIYIVGAALILLTLGYWLASR